MSEEIKNIIELGDTVRVMKKEKKHVYVCFIRTIHLGFGNYKGNYTSYCRVRTLLTEKEYVVYNPLKFAVNVKQSPEDWNVK